MGQFRGFFSCPCDGRCAAPGQVPGHDGGRAGTAEHRPALCSPRCHPPEAAAGKRPRSARGDEPEPASRILLAARRQQHGGDARGILLTPRDARRQKLFTTLGHSPALAAPVPPQGAGSPAHGGVIHTAPGTMEIQGQAPATPPSRSGSPARLGLAQLRRLLIPPQPEYGGEPRLPSTLAGIRPPPSPGALPAKPRARARSPLRSPPAAAARPRTAPAPRA